MAMLFSVMSFAKTEEISCAAGTIVNKSITFDFESMTVLHAQGTSTSEVKSYSPWRVYKSHVVTFTPATDVTIESLVITCSGSSYAANGTLSNATATLNGTTLTITPTDGTKAFTFAASEKQVRWSGIVVNYSVAGEVIAVEAPEFDVTTANFQEAFTLNITSAEGTTLKYTTDQTNPATSETAIEVATNTAAVQITKSTQVRAIAIKGSDVSEEKKMTYCLVNTPATAYTVAEAMAVIDAGLGLDNELYIKGTISKIESFNDTYGSITYWIADEEGNEFECYSGLGLNKEKFTSIDDLTVGYHVVACGTMKKYKEIYEFNYNNYLVEYTAPAVTKHTVTVSANNAEWGTVEGAGEYEENEQVTVTALANDGYEFVNWTEGGNEVSTRANYSFNATADRNLVANFQKEVILETVYFINTNGWENVHAYAWTDGEGSNDAWPGVPATKEAAYQIAGYDVYSYTAEQGTFDKVIFNNGNNGLQTEDLAWTPNHYYTNGEWLEKAAAEDKLATPAVITYVLMGVAGDWTTGIALTQNPENENEYMLLGQEIAEGDAVKVVTLSDGQAINYCGNVEEGSVAYTLDEEYKNIVLAPGIYDFYYKVDQDIIYIGGTPAASTTYTVTLLDNTESGEPLTSGAGEYEAGATVTVSASEDAEGWVFIGWMDEEGNLLANDPEYTFEIYSDVALFALYAMEMELEVNDLEIITDPVFGLLGTADCAVGTLSFQLVVDAANQREDESYNIIEGTQIWLNEETELTFEEGVAANIDTENTSAQAMVLASLDDQLICFFLTMSAPAAETQVINVTDATVTYDESMALKLRVELENEDFVYVELAGFRYPGNVTDELVEGAEIALFENKDAFASANAVYVTVANDTHIEIYGEYSSWTGAKFQVTISGELPRYTIAANAENGTVNGAGSYIAAQTVTLHAVPNEGYEFENWTVADEVVSDKDVYEFLATGDLKIDANFKEAAKPTISYELNGGKLPAPAVPTNAELWEAFMPYYNTYYLANGKLTSERAPQTMDNATTFAANYMMDIMTDAASEYKWLGDYVLEVTTAAGRSIDTEVLWRFGVAAFFNCKAAAASTWNGNADFTEAGKPENWGPAYQAAHELVLPTEPVATDFVLPTPTKEDATFKGWYDNAEGTGTAMTVIPAGWYGVLYALWTTDGPTTDLENTQVSVNAVKIIKNGQLVIIRNGVEYNANGAILK